jgi:hypothetical protein
MTVMRFGRAAVFVLLLPQLGCMPRSRSAQPAPPLPVERAEAVLVLQRLDVPVEAPVFLREDLVDAVAAGLRVIRAQYPAVRTIEARHDDARFELHLEDSTMRALTARFPARWVGDTLLAETGIRAIDSANASLGVRAVRISSSGTDSPGKTLSLLFERPIITWLMALRYDNVPGVRWAGSPVYFGESDEIDVREEGRLLYFAFSHGWGDCEAGCLSRHVWRFRYDRRTSFVSQVDEVGPPLPAPPNTPLQQTKPRGIL